MANRNLCETIFGQIIKLANECGPGKPSDDMEQAAKRWMLDALRETLNNGTRREYEQLVACLRHDVTTRLGQQPAGRELLAKVRYWLEDELILICPKSEDYIKALKDRVRTQADPNFVLRDFRHNLDDTPIPPDPNAPLYFDIEFKSEYVQFSQSYHAKYEHNERDPLSVVAQCMFVVIHRDGIFFTLHDRSFSGADDRLSKYAMITGRVAAEDINNPPINPSTSLYSVCWRTLRRELQELDELGLPDDVASLFTVDGWVDSQTRIVPRRDPVGSYEAENGKVISVLFVIRTTVDEYNKKLTPRGPNLIPVTPQEFSLFHRLDLLNDILKHNSCNSCLRDATSSGLRDAKGAVTTYHPERTSCIIRDVSGKIDRQLLEHFSILDNDLSRDDNISKYRTRLGENTAIIAVDVPDYSRLDSNTIHQLRLNLETLIKSFFPSYTDYTFTVQKNPTGYLIVLQQMVGKPAFLSLIAYFFAIYLSMKLSKINNRLAEINEKLARIDEWKSIPDVRLALHIDSLPPFDGSSFTGNGINQVLDIVSVAQPRQILSSLSFVMHLLVDLERAGIDNVQHHEHENDLFYREAHPARFLSEDELAWLLRALGLPNNVIFDLFDDPYVKACYENRGLPIGDFGFFVQANRLRYRVFNLGIFNDTDQPDYGNRVPPTARIPIVSRNAKTTLDEMERLVNGIKYAEHLMMNGYSNVRMMREIFKTYVRDRRLPIKFLKSLKIVFSDFNQFQEINEKRELVITKANWVRGFLYAQYIAQAFQQNPTRHTNTDTKIVINRVRYGFNVLKVIYIARHEHDDKDDYWNDYRDDYRDNIRFTVLMPGNAFELSPVFIINRGDPLYHGFLEISEKYVEEGIKENSVELNVSEYAPNNKGEELLRKVFVAPTDINGVDQACYDNLVDLMSNRPHDLVKLMEENPEDACSGDKPQLGEYYTELLKEKDFAEAFRLQCCIDIVEGQSRLLDDEDFCAQDGTFDVQRFLALFRA